MQKGVIYVRVSDPGQVNGTSLGNQEKACREYAQKNRIDVLQAFVEEGESATAANRTEFLKALQFCREQKGKIQFFIVWKIDRFARNTDDHFAVRAKLKQFGVVLVSVTEPITQDPTGKLMETLLAGYAEFENEVRKQRCMSGMKARLRDGIWCWCPPIGYIHSKGIRDKRKTMPDVPDEERFHLIQRGLYLYKTGNITFDALAKKSTEWGLRTRTGRPMRKQFWESIVKDKFYAGILIDPWTGEEHPGRHQPMIAIEDYRKIQRVKRKVSVNAGRQRLVCNPDFPLRKFIMCECKHPYTASWSTGRSKKYAFYFCRNNQCHYYNRSVAKAMIEKKFVEFLRQVSPTPEFLDSLKQTITNYLREQRFTHERQMQRHQSERRKLEKSKKELLEMRMNREISIEEFHEMKGMLEGKLADFDDSENGVESYPELGCALSQCSEFLEKVADEWNAIASPYKRRLQTVVFPQGATYRQSDGTFRTAILSPIFRLNQDFQGQKSGIVAGVGRSWNQIVADVKILHELVNEIREGDTTQAAAVALTRH